MEFGSPKDCLAIKDLRFCRPRPKLRPGFGSHTSFGLPTDGTSGNVNGCVHLPLLCQPRDVATLGVLLDLA